MDHIRVGPRLNQPPPSDSPGFVVDVVVQRTEAKENRVVAQEMRGGDKSARSAIAANKANVVTNQQSTHK